MDSWPVSLGRSRCERYAVTAAAALALVFIHNSFVCADVVAPVAAAPPDDGQWTMPAKNFASTRYSELNEINTAKRHESAGRLDLLDGRQQGAGGGAARREQHDVYRVALPQHSLCARPDQARRAAQVAVQAASRKQRRKASPAAMSSIAARSLPTASIFYNTLDGNTVAVDAETGKEVWKTKLGNINLGETMTMAPLVVKDKVLVGNSGGEMGVRGWIAALDAKDGKLVWKAYNTGPDTDVLIGPDFKPFYDKDRGKDLGETSWPPDAWKIGGGNVWGWISYDPDLNLIYYGSGNPGPWNPDQRPGDNKWTTTLFARDADTGQARWAYQMNPHDLFDHDGVNENILVDVPWQGAVRKVLLHPDRNGRLYMIDRATGEVLSAEPYAYINSNRGVDLKTGELLRNDEYKTGTDKTVRDICPTASGAKDWNPSAFSPRTGFSTFRTTTSAWITGPEQVSYIAGTPYVGAEVKQKAGPGGNRGEFDAWDVAGEKKVWSLKEKFPVWSGALATAGDVVFYGTMEGWFKAVDAHDGNLLWQFKTGSGIIGQPTTYKGPDGHQYVAILSGVGGWSGAIVSGDLDPRDGTAALGFVNAMTDLPDVTTKGGMLYVFRLP